MLQLPFDLPKSLISYAEHFEQSPQKATSRLKGQLKKRGPDAVGHFLLAWFYHLNGQNEEAVEQAIKAKIYAPGSPFFEKLHYYLVHPNLFEAWTPQAGASYSSRSPDKTHLQGPVLNLDTLIERLAEVESERISISLEATEEDLDSTTVSSDDTDDIASDTLANIHEAQGKTEAAIRTYKRLKRLNKDKSDFYDEKISELKKLRNKQNKKER